MRSENCENKNVKDLLAKLRDCIEWITTEVDKLD